VDEVVYSQDAFENFIEGFGMDGETGLLVFLELS
jgi:hypothetical protein